MAMRAEIMIGVGAVLLVLTTGQAEAQRRIAPETRPAKLSDDLIEYLIEEISLHEPSIAPRGPFWPGSAAQLRAIERLAAAGPGAAKAAEVLVQLLASPTTVRIPDEKRLGHHKVSIADAAMRALGKIGPGAAPFVEKALKAGKGKTRQRAAEALAMIDIPADELWTWAIVDANSNVTVRAIAARQIGKSQGNIAEKALIAGLADKSPHVRRACIESLGKVGTARAVDPLVAIMAKEATGIGAYASNSLKQIGEPAVPAIIRALADDHYMGRSHAERALSGMKDPNATELLLAALRHDDARVRVPAAEAMAHVYSNEAMEVVLDMTGDGTAWVRQSAFHALHYIHSAKSMDRFVKAGELARSALANDPNANVRAAAAFSLERMVFAREENRDALIAALGDKAPLVRAKAAATLYCFPATQAGIDGLAGLLADDDTLVRRHAVQTLGNLGNAARATAGKVATLLTDDHWMVRLDAATSLGQLGNPAGIDPLIDALAVAEDALFAAKNKMPLHAIIHQARQSLGRLTKVHPPYQNAAAWRKWQQSRDSTRPATRPAARPKSSRTPSP